VAEVTLETLHAAMIRRFDNVDAALREHRTDFDRIERQLGVIGNDIANIKQELANLTGDIGDLIGNRRRVTERLDALEQRLAEVEARLPR
jgi:septal ring factor EnvC (AmiA/AmiB activator)